MRKNNKINGKSKKKKTKPKHKVKGKSRGKDKRKNHKVPGQIIYESYTIKCDNVPADVKILKNPDENIKTYSLKTKELKEATLAFLDDIKADLLRKVVITSQEALDIKMAQKLRLKFWRIGKGLIRKKMPHISEDEMNAIVVYLINDALGLGDIEYLLNDNLLEEICVNSASSPLWVYHRKYGWLKSNIKIPSENQIWNYSSSIARRVGRQINIQSPLLDAYLPTGDRVNATLLPISSFGNTITIRKFARKPWTITDLIKSGTLTSEIAALLWLAIHYETNMLISGGTGAGKTSTLNVLSSFMPQNQRIVSIEQTREIVLPKYLQWVPLTVREKTSEGRGGISMLDLMVNSLRMRPDRIIVGEIRRAEEAQVLFEAMHTGHSVYATLHAETVGETLRRLTNPPIDIPHVMLESLHLIVTMYRDRRTGRRRAFEIGEIVPDKNEKINVNIIYKWDPSSDKIIKNKKSVRLVSIIKRYTNMTDKEIEKDLKDRKRILEWMVKHNVNTVPGVGAIVSKYYDNPSKVMNMIKNSK